MNIRNLGFFILLFSVSGISYWAGSQRAAHTAAPVEIVASQTSLPQDDANKIHQLLAEYEEYIQLKDQKEKFQTADEMLGKSMLLFLASVGATFSRPATTAYIQTPVEQRIEDATPIESAQTEATITDAPSISAADPASGPQATVRSTDEEPRDGQNANFILEDPQKSLTQSSLMNRLPKRFDSIKGLYSGDVRFFKGHLKDSSKLVSMEINYELNEDKLTGQFRLEMEGSTWSSTGDNNDLYLPPSGQSGIFIKLGEREFLHIIRQVNQGNVLMANWYENNELTGRIRFKR